MGKSSSIPHHALTISVRSSWIEFVPCTRAMLYALILILPLTVSRRGVALFIIATVLCYLRHFAFVQGLPQLG